MASLPFQVVIRRPRCSSFASDMMPAFLEFRNKPASASTQSSSPSAKLSECESTPRKIERNGELTEDVTRLSCHVVTNTRDPSRGQPKLPSLAEHRPKPHTTSIFHPNQQLNHQHHNNASSTINRTHLPASSCSATLSIHPYAFPTPICELREHLQGRPR